MWPLCTANNFLWLLLPLLIGLLTGWWAWANRGTEVRSAYAAPEPATVRPPAPVEAPMAFKTADDAGSTGSLSSAAALGAAALTAIGIPTAKGAPDDLLQIKGVGPKLNALLHGLGVTRFDQIAAWGAGEITKVDEHLGSFRGRIVRDEWVEQAGLLARGMIKEFEAKFGKLDSENK